MFEAKHISIAIKRAPAEIYRFASNPANLPKWASGLSGATITKSGDAWVSESPMGQVKIRFVPENSFGVMDHDVTIPTGQVFHNPFRVLKNDDGSEVVFTLYRLPEVTDTDLEKDAAMVRKDLQTLKTILENK